MTAPQKMKNKKRKKWLWLSNVYVLQVTVLESRGVYVESEERRQHRKMGGKIKDSDREI